MSPLCAHARELRTEASAAQLGVCFLFKLAYEGSRGLQRRDARLLYDVQQHVRPVYYASELGLFPNPEQELGRPCIIGPLLLLIQPHGMSIA